MRHDIIENSFKPLYGEPCWDVNHERYLNLSMNFGRPRLRVREPYETTSKLERVRENAAQRIVTVRGQWWLWITSAYWRLTSHAASLATACSSNKKIERARLALQGQQLVNVAVQPKTGATRFTFDLGCVLHARRLNPNYDAAIWMLYKPNGYVLSIYPNGTFSHERGNTVRERRKSIDVEVRGDDK
jgi:hypothetical protein